MTQTDITPTVRRNIRQHGIEHGFCGRRGPLSTAAIDSYFTLALPQFGAQPAIATAPFLRTDHPGLHSGAAVIIERHPTGYSPNSWLISDTEHRLPLGYVSGPAHADGMAWRLSTAVPAPYAIVGTIDSTTTARHLAPASIRLLGIEVTGADAHWWFDADGAPMTASDAAVFADPVELEARLNADLAGLRSDHVKVPDADLRARIERVLAPHLPSVLDAAGRHPVIRLHWAARTSGVGTWSLFSRSLRQVDINFDRARPLFFRAPAMGFTFTMHGLLRP